MYSGIAFFLFKLFLFYLKVCDAYVEQHVCYIGINVLWWFAAPINTSSRFTAQHALGIYTNALPRLAPYAPGITFLLRKYLIFSEQCTFYHAFGGEFLWSFLTEMRF